MKAKAIFSQKGLISPARRARSAKKREPMLRLPIERRMIPTKARAMPTEQMKTYFQAASSEDFFLSK